MKRALVIGALVLLVTVLAATAWIYHALSNPGAYRDDIARVVREATGRDFTVSGEMTLRVSLTPRLRMEQVGFANMATGSRPEMIQAEALEISLALLPLLDNRIEIVDLHLVGVDALLETDAADQPNWGFVGSLHQVTRWLEHLEIGTVRIERAVMRFRDGATGDSETVGVPVLTVDPELDDDMLALSGRIVAAGEELAFDGMVGVLAGLATRGRLPVDLAFGWRGTDGRLATEAVLSDDRLSLEDLSLGWAGLALTGRVDVIDGPVPRIEGVLVTERLDLRPVLGRGDGEAGGGLVPAVELPLGWAAAFEADLDLRADEVRLPGLALGRTELTVVVEDGAVTVDPLETVIFGGEVTGLLAARARGEETELRTALRGHDVDLGDLVRLASGRAVLTMPTDMAIDLIGRGRTLDAAVRRLDGSVTLEADSGRIEDGVVDLLTGDLLVLARRTVAGSGSVGIACMIARVDFASGVGDVAHLLLATRELSLGGDGTIDLARERIDLTLVPRPRNTSLLNLATPVLVRGPLASPSIGPDPAGVARHAGTLAAGLLLGPVALLLPLMDAQIGSSDDCRKAVEAAKQAGAGVEDRSLLERGARGVGDVIEGIGEGLGGIGRGLGIGR